MVNKPEKNFHQKWWFWLIIFFGFLIVVSSFSGDSKDSNCPKTYETEYRICQENAQSAYDAWVNYQQSLQEYCDLDYTNPICIALLP